MTNFLKALYSLWVMIWFIIIILCCFPLILFFLFLSEKKRLSAMLSLTRFMSNLWLALCGIFTKQYNRPRKEIEGAKVIIANHNSYLDAPTVVQTLGFPFKTLGKMEIAKVPLFGLLYQSVVILIDRSTSMARAKSYIQMVDTIKNGLPVLLFPEGTFDEDNTQFKTFQDGAFKLAIDAQAQIIPLLLVDTYDRMIPHSLLKFSPGINRVVWLPIIETIGLNKKQDTDLKKYTQAYMQACMNHAKSNDINTTISFAQEWLQQHTFATYQSV